MLSRLLIENFAIVESVEIAFAPGFNAITGETGSGKSVLIGALELALGERARADAVRAGCKLAAAEAVFEPPFPQALRTLIIKEIGIEWDPAEPLELRREVTAQGRSRALIAGQSVQVADLKRVGERLADLHGQHEHQSLFHASSQRDALDAYGGCAEMAAKYRERYAECAGMRKRRDELEGEARDFEKKLDFLAFQIEELEQASPRAGELAELEMEESRLANAETLARAAREAYALLYEGIEEGAPAIVAALAQARRNLDQIARLDPAMKELPSRTDEIKALVEDLAQEAGRYAELCEPDPKRLDEIVARSEALRRLLRKHGAANEEELAAMLNQLRAERDRMNLDERERNEIGAKLDASRAELIALGGALFKARQKEGRKLGEEASGTLAKIGMEKAAFSVEVTAAPEPGPDGMDRVEFMLAANIGEGAHPLREVASGGELSRTMLAIKTALAARDAIGTLVFDEIDAGISGQTAARVGRLMEKLAESHQILCITHHASIAARAGSHYSVRKAERQGRTIATVNALSNAERIEELALMMGDDGQSAAGKKLARQLLETA